MTLLRADVVRVVDEYRNGAPVISGPGVLSSGLYQRGYQPDVIYNMELAYATPIATGLALATPRQKVVSLEGDGSLAAGMPVLATINRYRPANLVVVVVDDGLYASVNDASRRTVTSTGTDLAHVALACGLDPYLVREVRTAEELTVSFRKACLEPGPWILVCKIPLDNGEELERVRPLHDVVEAAINFKREMMSRGY